MTFGYSLVNCLFSQFSRIFSTSSNAKDSSYSLPNQLSQRLAGEIHKFYHSPGANSSEESKFKKELDAFLDNSSVKDSHSSTWNSHRYTWENRGVVENNLSFFASFFGIKTAGGGCLFNNISEIMTFVNQLRYAWTIHRGMLCPNEKKYLLDIGLEKTIGKIIELAGSIDTFKKLAMLGYSKEEIRDLITLEGKYVLRVAQEPKKLSQAEAEVLSFLGQRDYQTSSNNKIKTLVLTASEGDGKVDVVFRAEMHMEFFDALKSHCNTRYRLVDSIKKLKEELALAAIDKPDMVVIRGHGCQDCIDLSRRENLSSDTAIPEFKNLNAKTTVIFGSCKTGEGKNKTWNIANYIQSIAPQLRIFAPTVSITSMSLKFSSGEVKPIFIDCKRNGIIVSSSDPKDL